tara:strand:- start:3476 stop:3835 length:360 start_codon:yes stop_codon:yes gene_type:complete
MNKPKYHRVLHNVGNKPYLNKRIVADLTGGKFVITGSTHHLQVEVSNSSDPNFEGELLVLRDGLWKRLFQKGFFEGDGSAPRLPKVLFYLAQDKQMPSIAIDEIDGVEFVYGSYRFTWI